jgi:D-aminopeptidase
VVGLKPYKTSRPVKLEIRCNDVVIAELASYLSGVQRTIGNTVVFTGHDMTKASKFLIAVLYLRMPEDK